MKLAKFLADYLEQEGENNNDGTMQEVLEQGIKAFEQTKMKVACKCGAEVELTVVGGQYQYVYEGTCPKCGTMWQLKDIISECDENIEIGEHGYPAECENSSCDKCVLTKTEKQDRDCPHRKDIK